MPKPDGAALPSRDLQDSTVRICKVSGQKIKFKIATNEPTKLLKIKEGDFASHDVAENKALKCFCHDHTESNGFNGFLEFEKIYFSTPSCQSGTKVGLTGSIMDQSTGRVGSANALASRACAGNRAC